MKTAAVAEVAGKIEMPGSGQVVAAAAVAVEAAVQEAHLVGTQDAAEMMVIALLEVMHRSSLKGYPVILRIVVAALHQIVVSVEDTALVEEVETGHWLQVVVMPLHSLMLVQLETFVMLTSRLLAVSDSGDVSYITRLITNDE